MVNSREAMANAHRLLSNAERWTASGEHSKAELAVQIADRWLTVARETELLAEVVRERV